MTDFWAALTPDRLQQLHDVELAVFCLIVVVGDLVSSVRWGR